MASPWAYERPMVYVNTFCSSRFVRVGFRALTLSFGFGAVSAQEPAARVTLPASTSAGSQEEPLQEGVVLSLEELLLRARASNPVMGLARAGLSDYRAQFDRAHYAWVPTLSVDGLLAPLPERNAVKMCAGPGVWDDTTSPQLSVVQPCPGQEDVITDERITADTEIGILVQAKARITLPIYAFGKIEHGLNAARAGIEVGKAGIDHARGELDYLVKQAYFGAQMAASAHRCLRMKSTRKDQEGD